MLALGKDCANGSWFPRRVTNTCAVKDHGHSVTFLELINKDAFRGVFLRFYACEELFFCFDEVVGLIFL